MFALLTSTQLTFLGLALLFYAVSLGLLWKDKISWAVFALTVAGLFTFLLAAFMDTHLHIWDERFHALVAKNMMQQPFRPALYNEVWIPFEHDRWDRQHIWLHKQPLFMWLMSGSMKLFGVNPTAIRIPSAILATLLISALFRMGKLLVSPKTGFVVAFLWATAFYAFQLVSGQQGMDHNDLAFVCLITFSIWAWIEYQLETRPKYRLRWLLLIGLFSGLAVLCKWLVGLLVYAAWGVYWLLNKIQWSELKNMLLSLIVTIVVFLPWQLYTFSRFPAEAAFEMKFNSLHFTSVVSGHGGNAFFYFEKLPDLYGWFITVLLPIGLFFLFKRIKFKALRIPIVTMPVVVYLFFTIAKTKIQTFPFVVAPLLLLGVACFITYLISFIKHENIGKTILLIGIVSLFWLNFQPLKLAKLHTDFKKENWEKRVLNHNRLLFKKYQETFPENAILFNIPGRFYVDAMFYTDFPAYSIIPNKVQYQAVKKDKRTIVIVDPKEPLPDYLANDSTIIITNDLIYEHE